MKILARFFYPLSFFFALLCIICGIGTFPYIKAAIYSDKKKAQMCSEIMEIANVKKISRIIQTKDFDPIFDIYIEMEDDTKIIFTGVHYEGDVLLFKMLPRIGDFAFFICEYNTKAKGFSYYVFNIYDEFETGLPEIGKSVFNRKNVIEVLINYRKILDKVNTFHIASNLFLDYLSEGKDAEAFRVFDGVVNDNAWAVGYKEIRCMYKYSDVYKDTFFGNHARWEE